MLFNKIKLIKRFKGEKNYYGNEGKHKGNF